MKRIITSLVVAVTLRSFFATPCMAQGAVGSAVGNATQPVVGKSNPSRQTTLSATDADAIERKKAFVDTAEAVSKQTKGWWNRKEWAAAIASYSALLRDYDGLPAATKKEMRGAASGSAYNLACALSLLGHSNDAVAALHRAVEEFAYSDYANMKGDTDLDPLRARPDFIALLDKVRKVGDYLTVIKSAPAYPTRHDRSVPTIRYESKNASDLRDLRERYHLDAVAGNGDEVSRLKNLMLWVNRQVEHDGSASPPPKRNAPALLKVAKEGKVGLNCRMMSTVLNDVLLAEGFATRHITCMPKNPDDLDCHVINVVYCNTLQKWVWMDASFAGYWTDDAGGLLSIQEVRERILAGKPIQGAPTLHHNADSYTESQYRDYMTKNLYWMLAPIESRFDYETGGKAKYVALVPPGGKHGWEGNTYYTSDPAAFWQKP